MKIPIDIALTPTVLSPIIAKKKTLTHLPHICHSCFCHTDVIWCHDVILWRHLTSWRHSVRALTNWQTDGKMDRRKQGTDSMTSTADAGGKNVDMYVTDKTNQGRKIILIIMWWDKKQLRFSCQSFSVVKKLLVYASTFFNSLPKPPLTNMNYHTRNVHIYGLLQSKYNTNIKQVQFLFHTQVNDLELEMKGSDHRKKYSPAINRNKWNKQVRVSSISHLCGRY